MLSSLKGKVAFCIGGTSGIGRAMAKRLALMQANVVIATRNKAAGSELVKELKAINHRGTFEAIQCEGTSMKSINQACSDFGSVFGKLNYLVMSQGTASMNLRTETSEGIDEKMALHYYGRIQCVRSLEPILKQTAATEEVRVLSILSGGVHSPYDKLNDLGLKNSYSLTNAANAAGFYTDLAFDQLSRNFGQCNVSFIHASPGFVKTNYLNSLPFPMNVFSRLSAMTPEECAENMLDKGLIAPHLGQDVSKFAGFHIIKFNGSLGNKTSLHQIEYRNAVWKHTEETLDAALKSP